MSPGERVAKPRGAGLQPAASPAGIRAPGGFGVGFRGSASAPSSAGRVGVGGLRGAGKGSGLRHAERSAPASQRQAGFVDFYLFILKF